MPDKYEVPGSSPDRPTSHHYKSDPHGLTNFAVLQLFERTLGRLETQ
jgi:hypothetical protein